MWKGEVEKREEYESKEYLGKRVHKLSSDCVIFILIFMRYEVQPISTIILLFN